MAPCRITRGNFHSSDDFADGYRILSWGWGDVFSWYSNRIKLSPLPEVRMPLLYLVSYPVYLLGTFTYSLARH